MKNLKANLKLKIFSILIAIALWSFVIGIENPEMVKDYTNIPITLKKLESIYDRGYTIVGDKDISVNLKLKGKTNDFINVNASDIRAEVDMSQYNENDSSIPIKFIVPEGITITEKSISNLPIKIEKVESKAVPVEIIEEGEPKNDRIVEKTATIPETVVVKGSESLIQSVEKAVSSVDLSQIDTATTRNLPLAVVDFSGNEITGVDLSQEYVNVSFNVYLVKKVPVTIVTENELPDQTFEVLRQLSADEVGVYGAPEVVNKLKEIKTHPLDLKKVVSDGSYDLTLELPEGVKLSNKNVDLKVKFILDKMITKHLNIKAENIELRNRPGKSTAAIISDDEFINFDIKGYKSKVNPIEPDGIKIYADLSGMTNGIQEVQLKMDEIPEVNFSNITPSTVKVRITEKQGEE
ncbi:MAG: CdaR family protein [Tissierellia bacterium]|nr:CdaR family protein [Tissierellia bacterium]